MKVGLDPKYRREFTENWKLDVNQIERACLLVPEEIEMDFCHWLTIADKDKRNGYYLCMGNREKLNEQGSSLSDPENCQYCANQMSGGAIGECKRQFVAPLLVYPGDGKGGIRGTVLSSQIVVWKFADQKFDRLIELKEQWAPKTDKRPDGDMSRLDLQIKCENKLYQNFQIDPIPPEKCAWPTGGPEFFQMLATMVKEYKTKDVKSLFGRVTQTKEQAQQLVNTIMGTLPAAGQIAPASTIADFDTLLSTAPTQAKSTQAQVVQSSSVPSTLQSVQQPTQQVAPTAFEDLLKSI